MNNKLLYNFGGGSAEGRAEMKNLLGGKGANLAEMTNLGLPVPPGFTITTEVCIAYQDSKSYPGTLEDQVKKSIGRIESTMGAKFGYAENPLLVSVRSGARVSMPGMMDTVLNLGLNDQTVKGLAARTGNKRFAYDSYRRLVQMFGDVVLGVKAGDKEANPFETVIEKLKHERGISEDVDLTADDWIIVINEFKSVIKERTGAEFPENPWDQFWAAIGAVFDSWNVERAITYRKLNKIPSSWGTAVNVQSMVFGNMGDDCATGVAFTRNPASGVKEFYGEFLTNAQGEDVVAGIRTPLPIADLEKVMPDSYGDLVKACSSLEDHYREMQDMEFTIQNGKLWMLQTRAGKRTGFAAIRIGVEMVEEGLISTQEAISRIEPDQLNQLLNPIFDIEEKQLAVKQGKLLAKGLNAGPGAASGAIYFSSSACIDAAQKGEKVLLVRVETSPEDIKGMDAAEGILTARGGMTSHAALVARQMGKVCVAGCSDINLDYQKGEMYVAGLTFTEGDWLSLDGTTGEVIEGKISSVPSEIVRVLVDKTLSPQKSDSYHLYSKLMEWADNERRLKIRTNADQPDQCEVALSFGAQGIGLCRTEHMFFGGERIMAVREMILANSEEERETALGKILPMQREDFLGIFRTMDGLPVTIRTLDPPLHEFLLHSEGEIKTLANQMSLTVEQVNAKIESLRESNPMLGHRGCRLGNVYPEITRMQARAIFQAAAAAIKEDVEVHPEIMIPLVGFKNELVKQARVVRDTATEVMAEENVKISYLVGTMIELPRAALVADQIAEVAEFFSYGTNDLTQTAMGISRDDSGGFLPFYVEEGIINVDPFQAIDIEGVGKLMEIGVELGRKSRSSLKIGICGEHGGEPSSVMFCHRIGLDYVSCSPYRIPIARLAAAQAVLNAKLGI